MGLELELDSAGTTKSPRGSLGGSGVPLGRGRPQEANFGFEGTTSTPLEHVPGYNFDPPPTLDPILYFFPLP